MRKIASIFFLVATMSLSACASSNTYRYADKWNVETDSQVVDAMEYVKAYANLEASTEYSNLLSTIKDAIKSTAPHPELLDWDKFEKLQNVYELNIGSSDVNIMSHEEIFVFSSYLAFYDEDNDSVYILPQFYAATDTQKTYCLVHEVIHSLVPNRKRADSFSMVEGLVDWLTLQVCNDLCLDVTAAYQESILCLRMLMDIYGEENVVQAICEGRIAGVIDGSTKDGMAEKLNATLFVAHGNYSTTVEDVRDAVYAELDIISHAAEHEGVDINDWLDAITQIYEANGIKLDLSYF